MLIVGVAGVAHSLSGSQNSFFKTAEQKLFEKKRSRKKWHKNFSFQFDLMQSVKSEAEVLGRTVLTCLSQSCLQINTEYAERYASDEQSIKRKKH